MRKDLHQPIIEILSVRPSSYANAKQLSELIDGKLGYQMSQVEELISNGKCEFDIREKQLWIGLDIQSLQTPYSEIIEMIDLLKPKRGDFWVDLGAGYGRMGVVLSLICDEVQFYGYELEKLRVEEADRIYSLLNLQNAQMYCVDVAAADFELPDADLFFAYDFGSKADVDIVLEKLKEKSKYRSINVIARGRDIKNWIMMEHPWLSEVNSPIHRENWSLFVS
jgi:hypothetical protein